MGMIETEYDGCTYSVPETGRDENLNDMLTEIPGQDDTVTAKAFRDSRFYKWCMAFLMQDGDLGVPGGRYGTSTRSCAEVAIIVSLIMQYHNGEPITYHQLNSDMGLVVNSADGVASLLREDGPVVFETGFGPLGNDPIDLSDYLSEDDLASCEVDDCDNPADMCECGAAHCSDHPHYKDNEVCGGTGNHDGQDTDDCDECNPDKYEGIPD